MATPYVTVITTETSRHTLGTAAHVSAINASAEADPLLAFEPEQARPGRVSGGPMISGGILYAGVCAAALSCATACIGLVYLRPVEPPLPTVAAAAAVAAAGTAAVNSRPPGAEVWIDGVVRGTTPILLSLPAGLHTLEVRSGQMDRAVPLMIGPGAQVSRDIELGPESPETSAAASAPGAAGKAPARPLMQPAPDAPAATSAAPPAGWVAVAAPIALTISERGKRLGVSTDGRLLLPAGSHELQLANDDLEFTTTVPVQVPRGQVVAVQVQIPNGRLSINAVPWAEAIVDGRFVGVTPIANLSLPIGPHDVMWRHPELGERRESVSLAARTPARIGIDLRR